ncbi:MAG: hypothetical protein E7427_05450 [Ruminococcaceae bacterium]|nr:hypothetical protein [Oscillospiraceae bacterium]
MKSPYQMLNETAGTAECVVRGANPALFLNRCAAEGISLIAVQALDETTICVSLPLKALERARSAALRSQCELSLRAARGGKALGRRLWRRAFLAALLLLCLCLLAWTKLFIWEIDVVGNETVSAGRVRSALSDCGVGLGTFWPNLTSDNLRSELLTRLPELQWATVNIYGSRAEVVVRERIPAPPLFDADESVDLVAERIGFVTDVQALAGTAVVKPGSAVLPGDVLISGTADSAFSGQRSVHAAGSVTAETYYTLTAVAPAQAAVRGDESTAGSRWALLIGKNRVNFYGNSSICPDDCDKIVSIWECKIPGLFAFPLALVYEREVQRTLTAQERDLFLLRREMEQLLHQRLIGAVSDGEVESEHYSCSVRDGRVTVCLQARCSENIAKEQRK